MTEEKQKDKERKYLFASNFYQLRQQSVFTQESLAEEIGVSVRTIQRWEKAQTMPTTKYLNTITNIFGVTVDDLFRVKIKKQTVGKSTIAKNIAPAERVKTLKEELYDTRCGFSFLAKDI